MVLIAALVVKFVAGLLINPFNLFGVVWISISAILNAVIGIFLLKDSREFGCIHRCLVQTCCPSYSDQCQGGMSCLCTWFFCCLFTAVINLLPFEDSDLNVLIAGFRSIADRTQWRGGVPWAIEFSFFLAATVAALLAQLVGGYEGYKGFQDMQMGGNLLAEDGLPGQGGGPLWAENVLPGGPSDGGGDQGLAPPAQVPAMSGIRGSARAFQPFSGQGHRMIDVPSTGDAAA